MIKFAQIPSGSFAVLWRLADLRPWGTKSAVVGLVLSLASLACGQGLQFEFDAPGNLIVQAAENIAPPQILAQPQPQVVVPGALASFFVVAANTRGLAYQWRFNGTNIGGATRDALLLQNVGATNEGEYSVVLVNSSGSVTSAPAALMLDGDRDGLPDSWELASFGNLNQYPTGDSDGDGISNLDEFLDGTNPADSASASFRNLVWNGGNGDWHVASNWQPNFVPTSNDNVFFTGGAIVTLNSPAECGSLNLDGSTLTGSSTLTTTILNFNSGTLGGSQVVTVLSQMNWAGGTMIGTGRTVIPLGAALNVAGAGGVMMTTRTLENGGTVLWTSGDFNFGSGAVFTNRAGALFETRGTGGFRHVGGPIGRFDNAGTFRKSLNTGTLDASVSFNNYGAVEIQTGTLLLVVGGTHTGTFDVPAGTTLYLAGVHDASVGSSITGAGNFTVNGGTATLAGLVQVSGLNFFDGGTVNLNGNYICTNNTLTIAGATANFNGSGTVTPTVLNFSSGTLGGSQVVTVLSQMNWAGGTMIGTGRTVIPLGAALNVAGAGGVMMTTRTLENGGTVLWTSGDFNFGSGAVFTNRAGALFETRGAGGFGHVGGPIGRFDNAGTFRKSLNTGTTPVDPSVNFNNYGAVEIQTGILAASGGYNSTANSLLTCALGGTTAGAGYGRLAVAGTVTLNGALRVTLTNGFLPTTNDTFTVLTAGTRNGTFANFHYPSNAVTMQMSNSPNSVIVRVSEVLVVPQPVLLPPEISGPDILLSWTALSNITYRLEYETGPSFTNWTGLPGDITSLSNLASKLDALTSSNRLYRVRVVP